MVQEKKIEKAVALVYDNSTGEAPQIVASGKGTIAAKIIETARQAGVHIRQDQDMLELLAKVPVGQEIPVELYQAVAEILAFIYRTNGKYQQKRSG